ncbi:MAG: radical SAM protein [Parcubacteria group bacterium]
MEDGEFYLIDPKDIHEMTDSSDVRVIDLTEHPPETYAMPLKVQLQATERCNMRCITCAVYKNSSPEQLPFNQVCNILDKLSDFGVLNVQWSGGEPFARKDFPELVTYAASKGFKQNVYTNATMLTEEMISLSREHFFKMQISLDGTKELFEEITGVKLWNKFEKGLQSAISANIPDIVLATVLQEKNVAHMENVIRYASQSGAGKLRISMLVPIGRSRSVSWDRYSVTIDKFRHNWPRLKCISSDLGLDVDCFLEKQLCEDTVSGDIAKLISPGGHSFLYIDSKGFIYPFPFLTTAELRLGNIMADDLKEIWFKSEKLAELRNQTYENIGCGNCQLECSFVERSLVYAFTGRIDGPALLHAECTRKRR